MLIWWLLACAPAPDTEALEVALLRGRLGEAASLCAPMPELPTCAPAAGFAQVQEEQREASRVSREWLREAAAEHLAEDDATAAADTLAVALATWPDDAGFSQLAGQLREQAKQSDGARAVALWGALSAVPGLEEEARLAQHRAQLQVWLASPGHRTDVAGVDGAVGRDLLAMVDARYVEEPPWPRMARQAREDLRLLDADTAWGEAPVRDLATLQQALVTAIGAGSDEAVVTAVFVEGALAALDPWSRPVWPAEIASWQQHHDGVRLGVGLALYEDEGRVLVDHPLPDTSAWQANVRQGDEVRVLTDATGSLALADVPATSRLALAEQALAGDPALPVTLTLWRDGSEHVVTLPREPVRARTVEGWARNPDNSWRWWVADHIAYVRIPHFKPTTLDDFDQALSEFPDDTRAVVLDLRGNPGGDVNSAVQTADRFIAEGLLAEVAGRVPPETTSPDAEPGTDIAEWNEAVPGHGLEGVAVAVLVDPDTASAAEVLAGSLQERADARVIGDTTWGKGHMQALLADEQGRFALQLTNLVWALPSGHKLWRRGPERSGIVPDVALPVLSPGERYQLAQERLARTALRQHADGTPITPRPRPVREDLPRLSDDPDVLAALWVLQAKTR